MEEYTHEQIRYEQDTNMLLQVCEGTGGFTAKHWHNGFEILYILEGKMIINISDADHQIAAGGFAVINCKTVHANFYKDYCKYLLLQIPYETIFNNIPDIDTSLIRCVCKEESQVKGDYKSVQETLNKLESLYNSQKDCGYLLKLNSLIYELLYHLVTKFKTKTNPELKRKTDRNIQRLGVVLQYVRQHYAEKIYLSDVASMVALNREYFARFFRKYIGMTFMDYVFSVRLEHADYEIINTDYTINEISARCGFENNYKSFLKKYREQYGCSPMQKRSEKSKGYF